MAADSADPSSPDPSPPAGRVTRAWLLLPCLPVGIAGAVVLFLGLGDLGAPRWLGVVVALCFFPVLPVLWHMFAERPRQPPVSAIRGRSLERFALRALAVGLTVLAVSFETVGPRNLGGDFSRLIRRRPAEAPVQVSAPPPQQPQTPPPAPKPRPRHALEPFIPADANLVIALSDPATLRRFFSLLGADTKKKLAALEKCQILLDDARVLIASRDRKTRMVVIRAPGVIDQRNLYCLVGFLGSDKLGLRFMGDKGPVRFEIDGLFPRTLKFEAVDADTVVAADPAWKDTVGQKLFSDPAATPAGPLAAAIDRVDRGASLWAAGVAAADQGIWDVTLDAGVTDVNFPLRASATSPSGAAQRADVEINVPSEFASALP
jgi:hypothetical protein